tara:strand:+ start:2314 stop:2934 length:621 start_codon:yes stop_codon:yes gene_type:complete
MKKEMTTAEVDELVKEDYKNIRKIFYQYIFGNQENSVQIISYLLDNYINTPYVNDDDEIVLQGYLPREIYSLAEHPYLHETSYQAFAIHCDEKTDWSKCKIFERRLKIFILTAKKFSNVLNELHYINGYGLTAIQEISLHFSEEKFKYYPDYFKEFVTGYILNKYNLIESLVHIKHSSAWGRTAPAASSFKVYTKNLIEYSEEFNL